MRPLLWYDEAVTEDVPASTHVRQRSLPNVSTERLLSRLEHLRDQLMWRDEGGRAEFGERVRECINIERELVRRGEHFRLVTNGAHLTDVPLEVQLYAGPRPSNKEQQRGSQLA